MRPRIFLENEANYFCSNFQGVSVSRPCLEDFLASSKQNVYNEGTSEFLEYRDCALTEIEVLLFQTASQYRRAIDLMTTSSSYWAHVTTYYGMWFCAKALLLMFGCFVTNSYVVDVSNGVQGSQSLHKRQIGNGNGKILPSDPTRGPHQQFWSFFYEAVTPLQLIVDPNSVVCLNKINGDFTWPIKQRNDINYRTSFSKQAMELFSRSFNPLDFPNSLSGSLATQFNIFEILLMLTFNFARSFSLSTDALDGLLPGTTMSQKIDQLILNSTTPTLRIVPFI